MPLTQAARNYAAEQVAKNKLKFVSIWQGREAGAADKPTSGTPVGSSVINLTGSEGKGYANGKLVWVKTLTASVTGLVAGRAYFIVGAGVNSFELAEKSGGAGIKVAGAELTATTELILLSEETAVARIATAFAAGSADASTDTEKKIKIKAAKRATFAVFYEVEALGTGEAMAVEKLVEEESFAAEGEYNLTADKLEAPLSVA